MKYGLIVPTEYDIQVILMVVGGLVVICGVLFTALIDSLKNTIKTGNENIYLLIRDVKETADTSHQRLDQHIEAHHTK